MNKKIIATIAVSFCTQACVTPLRLSPEAHCAVSGYKLVSFTNSESFGVAGGYGSPTTTYSSEGRHVQCAPIESEADKERARHLASSAAPIFDYNDKTLLRSAYGWAGAVFWIVPGLGLWYYYGVVKKDEAIEQSQNILRSPASQRIEPQPNP